MVGSQEDVAGREPQPWRETPGPLLPVWSEGSLALTPEPTFAASMGNGTALAAL